MTFNQPSNQQPQQPNQPGGYDFGDYNFSQQAPPPPYGQQPYGQQPYGYSQPAPAPKRTGRRNCLLFLGCSALAVIIVCGCLFGVTYSFREVVVVTMWIQVAEGGGANGLTFNDAYELEIVCPDSQAEEFTRAFEIQYPQGALITLSNNTQLSADNGAVAVEGTITDNRPDSTAQVYEATFYIAQDKGGVIPFLGCIDRIEQTRP